MDDEDLYLAIRDNYVNVYYRGNSILKLDWKKESGTVTGEIHYKYLLRQTIEESKYVKVGESGIAKYRDLKRLFLEDIHEVREIKSAAKRFGGREKTGVHSIALKDSNRVLDLEIAFGEGKRAPRIDVVSLKSTDSAVEMKFFEAKHFSNKELRAQGNNDPKVFAQMQEYVQLLTTHHDEIIRSYRRICKNLVSLHGICERHPLRHSVLMEVLTKEKELVVDETPGLLVFGFDQDQKKGRSWHPHREKLKDRFKSRVHFMGEAASIRLS